MAFSRAYTHSNKKQVSKKVISYLSMAGIAFMLVWMLYFDSASIYKVYKLKSKHNKAKAKVEAFKQQNIELKQQVDNMEGNLQLVEKLAREKYGMQFKNEKVFKFVKPESQK